MRHLESMTVCEKCLEMRTSKTDYYSAMGNPTGHFKKPVIDNCIIHGQKSLLTKEIYNKYFKSPNNDRDVWFKQWAKQNNWEL